METRSCKKCGPQGLEKFYICKQANRHGNGEKTRYKCIVCSRVRRSARYRADPAASAASVAAWREANPGKSREIQRRYIQNNPEKYASWLEKRNQERLELKIRVLKHYGGDCACCSEGRHQFLAIDHVNGGGNKHRAEVKAPGSQFYVWLVKNGLPTGYRVLCHNCNFAIGAFGSCPHEHDRGVRQISAAPH